MACLRFGRRNTSSPEWTRLLARRGATSGKDFTGASSSDWYFIGAKPPCPYAGSLKKYCARIQTRNGYVFEETAQILNDDPVRVKELVEPFGDDENAKAQALASHPKQSLQKSLQKCGLNEEQLRAKLVVEAEAASKTDRDADLERDFAVIGSWAPDLAMKIWKRECEGHPFSDPTDHREHPRQDKYWLANPHYLQFCSLTTEESMESSGPRISRRSGRI